MGKQAIIIGAGPAGLTAAYELLKRTDVKPVILEKSGDIGGISKTINYKGNRMDIGGHRFFSKSDRVMNWWMNIMPLEKTTEENITIKYQNKTHSITTNATNTGEPANPGLVMLLRKRLSRIYFLRKFFNYPIQLSIDTLRKLGLLRTIRILLSYLFAQLVPRKPEKSLEDFLINRFGRELYLLFFKDYTEKVWGVPCNEISAEWGAQRIKGVSISKAIQHAAQMMMKKKKKATGDISQKDTETSLIEQFLYPALGPGQLWEEVARQIEVLGGTILMHQNVKSIELEEGMVKSVVAVSSLTGEETKLEGDYFFSTMPVQELIAGMQGSVPTDVKEIAAGLQYRDFITVGVLLEKLSTADNQTLNLDDTWIYIQERDVKVGRLQLFNNWSPYMVNKPGTVWIGMEYFCNEGDDFWRLTDEEIKRTAVAELEKMGLAQVQHVLDSTVHRVEKTYPAYFGTYNQFDKIRAFTDQFANLFLVGRNGMHKYNNADHSMLTAMVSVDNIAEGVVSKENIWEINTEQEYHEVKKEGERKQQLESLNELPKHNVSFTNFAFRQHKKFLWFTIIVCIIELLVFKYLYPFPSFIHDDSFVYLKMAYQNESLGTYPIGYPMFLRLFSVFSNSDTLLVLLQFLLLQGAGLIFFLTVTYFFEFRKFTKNMFFLFSIMNPVNLYLANTVSSDSLFTALSIIWFTLLVWIIQRPNLRLIILQIVVIFLAFTIRNNALYYPIITVLAIFQSKQILKHKIIAVAGSFLVIVFFIWHTRQLYFELSGVKQFSPFSGWQMANNALHAYRYVDSIDRKPVPKKFQELDAMVRNYFDTTRNVFKYPHELLLANTYYMWNKPSPLQQYVIRKYKINEPNITFKFWAHVGPLYYSYGKYIIQKYPDKYLQWYIIPNIAKFYAPPVEFLENYNMGTDSIKTIAMSWFHYKSKKVFVRSKDFKVKVLKFNPILIGCLNGLFLVSFIFFGILKGFSYHKSISRLLYLTFYFWLINFVFSVLAAPVGLRFQVFPTLIVFACTILMIEFIFIAAFEPSKSKRNAFVPASNLT